YQYSLYYLSEYLTAHFGKETIILLDEYDTPIISGFSNNYYNEIISFMQVFLGTTFKDNPYLAKGLITGILRVAKESLFSEFNNPGVYTLTSLYFSDKFGFTEQETTRALTYFGLQNELDNIKKWYDGYKFGETENIYNPWSIVNYIARHEEGFSPYWINSGTDPLIKRQLLEPDVDQTYDDLQKLIAGEIITKTLYENFVFSDFEHHKSLLWTLLTFSGYLTIVKKVSADEYQLKIPNFEVTKLFRDIIIGWLETEHKVKKERLVLTTQHLINNRIPEFERGFKEIMGDTMSYFDTQGRPENVYQAYVLGLLAIIGDDYIIKSNRESGAGRYDILLIPHDPERYGVVIEIKQIQRKEKEKKASFIQRINRELNTALAQIEHNRYYQELLDHKVKKIIKLPIVFSGKEPFITPVPPA
ncbi:MAG: AAA family ATPase, partial [Bacteroidetes bacterium]